MRIGYSYPAGHSRGFVSMGYWAWVVVAFFLLPFLALAAVAWAVAWLGLAAAEGAIRAWRWWRQRNAPEWAKRPLKQ